MKKGLKFLLLSLAFGFLFAAPVNALKSAVYFEGGAENFVFYPGTSWSETDLFDDFKDVMPGDTLTEEIRVRNAAPEFDYVKIYLRAEAHSEENELSESIAKREDVSSMQDFLSQLKMQVYNGADLIYSDSPDKTGALNSGVLLGEFYDGNETKLTIKLSVPAELDNKYMHRAGEVDWIFTAEAYKDGKPCCCDCSECQKCPDSGKDAGGTQTDPGSVEQSAGVAAGQSTKKPQNLPSTLDSIANVLIVLALSILGLALAIAIIYRIIRNKTE